MEGHDEGPAVCENTVGFVEVDSDSPLLLPMPVSNSTGTCNLSRVPLGG